MSRPDRHRRPPPKADPHTYSPYDTFRLPAGKALDEHLRHLVAFWSPDSVPHQFARRCLAALDQAAGEVKRLRRERDDLRRLAPLERLPVSVTATADLDALLRETPLDPDSLAAELEDA